MKKEVLNRPDFWGADRFLLQEDADHQCLWSGMHNQAQNIIKTKISDL